MNAILKLGQSLSGTVRTLSAQFGAPLRVFRAVQARAAGDRSRFAYVEEVTFEGASGFFAVLSVAAREREFGVRSVATAVLRIAQFADGTMPTFAPNDIVVPQDGPYKNVAFLCEQQHSIDPASLMSSVPLVNAPATTELPL